MVLAALTSNPLFLAICGWIAMIILTLVGFWSQRFIKPSERQNLDLQALVQHREVLDDRLQTMETELGAVKEQLKDALAQTVALQERNNELVLENSQLRGVNAEYQQRIITLQDRLLEAQLTASIYQQQRDEIVKRYNIHTTIT